MTPGLHNVSEITPHLDDLQRTRVRALTAFAEWYGGGKAALQELRSAAEQLRKRGDGLGARAYLWLGEAAIVDRDDALLNGIAQPLRVASETAADDDTGVRLRLLLAVITGSWTSLMREAGTGRLEPGLAALVHARLARYLAWEGEGEGAEDYYRRAVEAATSARLPGDVVQAIHSWTTVVPRFGAVDEETLNRPALAEAVKGSRKYLGGDRDWLSVALQQLQRDQKPDAHRSLRRYLWEARLSGHLRAELQAYEQLGQLYLASQAPVLGVRSLVLSGLAKEARAAASELPFVVDVEDFLASRAPWVLASALVVVAAQGDLVPPERVVALVPRLAQWSRGDPQGPSGPQVDQQAVRALCALAVQLPDEMLEDVLAVIEPLIPRDPGHHRHSDEAMLDALVRLFATHPNSRDRVGPLLAQCLQIEDLATQLAPRLHPIAGGRELIPHLMPLADKNLRQALDVLCGLEVRHPAVLAEAERRVGAVLARQPRADELQPDAHERSWSILGVDVRASLYGRLLGQERCVALGLQWMRLAEDAEDVAANRAMALQGVRLLADLLPATTRSSLFERAVRLLDPDAKLSHLDLESRLTLHPLSSGRLDLGTGLFPQEALRAAARLASSPEDASLLAPLILNGLRSMDAGSARASAEALVSVGPQRLAVDVQQLALHPSNEARAAAAALWARSPTLDPGTGKTLAEDPSQYVRSELAGVLSQVKEKAPDLAEALRVQLLHDASAFVRWRANAAGESESLPAEDDLGASSVGQVVGI